MSEENRIGDIRIEITTDEIKYHTEDFSAPEVVFWLEMVKTTVVEMLLEGADKSN